MSILTGLIIIICSGIVIWIVVGSIKDIKTKGQIK